MGLGVGSYIKYEQ